MLIKDIMTSNVEVVTPETSIKDAARRMRSSDIGILPVCEEGKCIGVITDRDITIRATAQGFDPATTKVNEIMTHTVVYCSQDDDIYTAARVMEDKQIRRIIVLDTNKQVIGLCSLSDLALDTNDLQLTGEILHEVSRHGW